MSTTDLGSLVGTLTPEGALSLMQALQAQNQASLAQNTQQAAEAAQQAQGQYQQAAGAPAPGFLPGDTAVPTLFGGLAAAITGDPSFRERAQQEIKAQRIGLLQARADNLQALRDSWKEKADAAAQAGDLEAKLTAQQKFETVSKAHDTVLEKWKQEQATGRVEAQQTGAMAREKAGNVQSERNALISKGIDPDTGKLLPYVAKGSMAFGGEAGAAAAVSPLVRTLDGPSGEPIQILDLGNFKGTTASNAALQFAGENGVHPVAHDEFKVITDIQGARDNIVDILAQLEAAGRQPLTPGQRAAGFIGLRAGAMAQVFPTLAAFNSWRTAAIRNLRATAGSGGLRINQREIELAVANDLPKYTDTQPVARQKMANVQAMLNNALAPLVTSDWRRAAREARAKGMSSLPRKGLVKMIKPDGALAQVPVSEFKSKINKGWARVAWEEPVPPSAAPASPEDPLGIE